MREISLGAIRKPIHCSESTSGSVSGRTPEALAEAEAYTGAKGTEAVGHLLNTYIHTAGEYVPVAGPFVASLIDKAESGDVGGAISQVAALAAAHQATTKGVPAINGKYWAAYSSATEDAWTKAKADAAKATIPKKTDYPTCDSRARHISRSETIVCWIMTYNRRSGSSYFAV